MTQPLRPFLSYYGAKWMLAKHYPVPLHSRIVEPFAGAAGYSTRYPDRQVTLIDSNPKVAGVWEYLTRASRREIMRLPLIACGERADDLPVTQEARWLIGWWVNKGAAMPHQTLSAWARQPEYASQFWGPVIRQRIADQVDRIRHWRVTCGDYRDDVHPDAGTTWFVDPPYQGAPGRKYPHHRVDYGELALWCKARQGQLIVCEQAGADWLPFTPLVDTYSTLGRRDKTRATPREVLWTG